MKLTSYISKALRPIYLLVLVAHDQHNDRFRTLGKSTLNLPNLVKFQKTIIFLSEFLKKKQGQK